MSFVSSNWKKLLSQSAKKEGSGSRLPRSKASRKRKRAKAEAKPGSAESLLPGAHVNVSVGRTRPALKNREFVAMDCEMVGVGRGGKRSVLARCSIVDFEGKTLYDHFVKPLEKVSTSCHVS